MNPKTLQNINFGQSDASTEFQVSPKLLREGYYDLGGIESRLERSQHFLVLGYKGAGKSMIAERFRAIAADSPSFYTCPSPISIQEIALGDLKKVVPESFDTTARSQWTWVLFLCVKLIEILESDGLADPEAKARVSQAAEILRSHKIISKSPRSLHKFKATRMTTKVAFAKVFEQSWQFDQSTSDQTLNVWIGYMMAVLQNHISKRKTFVFLDGLDDLGPIRENQSALVGGLISAAKYVNQNLAERRAPCKVVICCRTDLYERLNLPTKGKIRADFGLDLDWYQDTRDVLNTHLVRMVEQRASLSQFAGGLFAKAFPARLDNVLTPLYMLRDTRHTPRDFLALLRNVQDAADDRQPLSRDQILNGMRAYSMKYFRDELDDALDSYMEPDTKLKVMDALGKLRSPAFTRSQFAQHLDPKVNVDSALDALFECSFVGSRTKAENATYFRFTYRNPAVRVSGADSLQAHSGLWKAYSLK